tara:strand:- start:1054 stop:1605 length:552 start_codon:yes stop_codon:yes gene_type:complete
MKKILTEWRKYIKENEMTQAYFDGGLYHAAPQDQLDGLRDNGIVNLPSEIDLEEEKAGIPCAKNPEMAREHGDVVLELDLQALEVSGQYNMSPDIKNDGGMRVTMTDSACDSGHGVHDMVDKLGTTIPFSYVKRIIFPQGSQPDVKQMRENGYSGVEIASFPEEGSGHLVSHWSPTEEGTHQP